MGLTYIDTCRSIRPHAALFHERRISSVTFTSAHLYGNVYMLWAWPARWPIRPIMGFWGAEFTKMGDSLFLRPMSRRAKFDTVSFILGREIRNRTNKITHIQ